MPVIMDKRELAPNVYQIEVDAPLIAERRQPGQFIVLRASEVAERIPLTIVDSDPVAGTITLIYQTLGESTRLLADLEMGDEIRDVAGPLGKATELQYVGRAVCIGGGIGVAPLYPIVRGLKQLSNEVTVVMGARTKDLLILENEMREIADEVIIATDDGSVGVHGYVSDALQGRLDGGYDPALAVAIGPLPMMRSVAEVTRPYGIHTMVSLNPVMVDGTGMCGGCRVTVGDKRLFACVDGPEFDGHKVDYAELANRQRMYHKHEKCTIHSAM
jgi:ferredoxin/flavodoxin---NADP+ reductase